MNRFARILGTGSAVPDEILTNADLEKIVDTSDEWITTRTGIKERRIAPPGWASSDYALIASEIAMKTAGITAKNLDMIIVGTVTPDAPLPSTACILQNKLGAVNAGVVDLVAACSGFIYGIAFAKSMIVTGQMDNILVIGVETLSRIVNWKDRNTCVLFGDGAGAAVVGVSHKPGGILDTFLKGDGSLSHLLEVPAGGGRRPLGPDNMNNGDRYIHMDGKGVFKSAVKAMGDAATNILKRTGVNSGELKLMIPHQANIRIIEATAKRIKLPMERVFVNIHKYGNTSAASVPIALDEAVREGRVEPGDKIILVAFGAGFTWGSALIEW